MKLQKRQLSILDILFDRPLGTTKLLDLLAGDGYDLSEDTLQRELKLLTEFGMILSVGSGPSRLHELSTLGRLEIKRSEQDIDSYMGDEYRQPSRYLPDIASSLAGYLAESTFSAEEKSIVSKYSEFVKTADTSILARWRQKWLIEFAWKSSSIEGNTYSILETETLLLDKIEAVGKSHQEALMIVNHQKAYDFILEHKQDYQTISVAQVLHLHKLLVEGLDVSFGVRSAPVRISGSRYIPLTHSHQIEEGLKKVVDAINLIIEPLDKALASLLLIAYLQPFADGNKRTSRVLANAILESHNYPPITLGGIEPTRYRRACIAFYELSDLKPMMNIVKDSYKIFLDLE